MTATTDSRGRFWGFFFIGFVSDGVPWFRTADLSAMSDFLGEGGTTGFSTTGRLLACSGSGSELDEKEFRKSIGSFVLKPYNN